MKDETRVEIRENQVVARQVAYESFQRQRITRNRFTITNLRDLQNLFCCLAHSQGPSDGVIE